MKPFWIGWLPQQKRPIRVKNSTAWCEGVEYLIGKECCRKWSPVFKANTKTTMKVESSFVSFVITLSLESVLCLCLLYFHLTLTSFHFIFIDYKILLHDSWCLTLNFLLLQHQNWGLEFQLPALWQCKLKFSEETVSIYMLKILQNA